MSERIFKSETLSELIDQARRSNEMEGALEKSIQLVYRAENTYNRASLHKSLAFHELNGSHNAIWIHATDWVNGDHTGQNNEVLARLSKSIYTKNGEPESDQATNVKLWLFSKDDEGETSETVYEFWKGTGLVIKWLGDDLKFDDGFSIINPDSPDWQKIEFVLDQLESEPTALKYTKLGVDWLKYIFSPEEVNSN